MTVSVAKDVLVLIGFLPIPKGNYVSFPHCHIVSHVNRCLKRNQQ